MDDIPEAKVATPHKATLRRFQLRLDMLHSLSQRFVNEPGCSSVRRARYLSADASPQGGHDYLCILEEIASRPSSWVPDAEEGQFNPFKGFDHCVRALPCQTLARGQTKVPMKVACLLNSILMEHGVDKLQHYRQEVRGWVSDQGTERAISKYPLRDGLAVLGKPLRLDMEGHDLPADVVGRGGEASRPFFHSSLDVSGLMHVVYNALEAAVTGQRHWPKFQKQLRAICKLCGEKSYQEVVANQMLRAAGASALDIQTLCAFNAKHLDWRWETLETVLAQWSPLRPVLQQYFKADMLEATDSGLALLVSQALQSPWHGLMLEWLRGLTEAVGKETRWMEGCYCHEAVLVGTGSRWKRRHQMLGATGAVTCPWKGKRLPSFALGHREAMTRSLDLAGSSEYHRALLNARPEDAAAIADMDVVVKRALAHALHDKLAYLEALPYKLAGAFGEYCGSSLQRAKKCVRECLQEFEEAGRAELHPTTLELLTGRSPVGQQLRAFAKDPERSLHKYPDAFVAIQELSLVPLVERRIEGEHAQVKLAAQRGFRWAGPAMVCARKRRHQVLAMLENPSLLQWVCQNWRSRDIFQRVLAHKCLPTTVNLMGRSERYARVYGYAVDDHFRDVEKMQQAARGRAAELKALHPPPQAASHDSKQIVGFLKAHLRPGSICSMPAAMLRACDPGRGPHPQLCALSTADIARAFSADQGELSVRDCRDHLFFSVVDPRPEDKFQMPCTLFLC